MNIMANRNESAVVTRHYVILVNGLARQIGVSVNLYEIAHKLARKACENKSRASSAIDGAVTVESHGVVQA
jgi:hypothetical protein